MHARKQYLNGECSHREYYSQFVTDGIKARVKSAFGIEALKKCITQGGGHFNEIPLYKWDNLVPSVPASTTKRMKEAGDYFTLAGGVCILKEAARQIAEEE